MTKILKQWTVAIDFNSTEEIAREIAIKLSEAAVVAAESAGGMEVVAQPYQWIQDVPADEVEDETP